MKGFTALLVVPVLAVSLGAAMAGEGAGTVVAIQGKVEVWPAGESTSRLLKLGDTVGEGATIETGPDAKVKIVFDQSVLTVGKAARIELTKYLYTRKKSILESLITITRGLVRSQVPHKLGPGSTFQMKSWNAIAGVKGTDFAMEVLDKKFSKIYVFEGEIEVRNLAGILKLLKGNEMTDIRQARAPIRVSPLPQNVREKTRIELKESRRGSLSSRVTQGRDKRRGKIAAAKVSGVSPQERVTGAELINPTGLSIPPAPSRVRPVIQPAKPAQPAPGKGADPLSGRPEGPPF